MYSCRFVTGVAGFAFFVFFYQEEIRTITQEGTKWGFGYAFIMLGVSSFLHLLAVFFFPLASKPGGNTRIGSGMRPDADLQLRYPCFWFCIADVSLVCTGSVSVLDLRSVRLSGTILIAQAPACCYRVAMPTCSLDGRMPNTTLCRRVVFFALLVRTLSYSPVLFPATGSARCACALPVCGLRPFPVDAVVFAPVSSRNGGRCVSSA